MAQIRTRETAAQVGDAGTITNNNGPLSNSQIDQNFINLNNDIATRLPLSGGTLTGSITTVNGGVGIIVGDDSRLADRNVANTLFVEGSQNNDRGYINFSSTTGNVLGAIAGGALTWNGNTIYHSGNIPTWNQNTTGNAATATTLQTARNINGVSFNGSANITITANTSNSLTFNNGGSGTTSGSTFNGSSAVTVSYNTIGAAAYINQAGTGYNFNTATPSTPTLYRVIWNTGDTAMVNSAAGNTTGLLLASQGSHSLWNAQLFAKQGSDPDLYLRGSSDAGGTISWGTWRTVLHSSNYNTYSPTLTGTGASGTWSINITGNAGSATTAAKTSAATVPASTAFSKWLFATTSTSGTLDWNDSSNTIPGTGSTLLLGNATNGPGGGNYYHPFNIEYAGIDGVGNVTQMAVAYGTPANEMYMRGRYGGSWTSWTRFLNSANYNSYSPTLTGTGASGTWGINITGNAATVTNGVYTTSNVMLLRSGITNSTYNSATTTGLYTVSYTGYSRNLMVWNTGGSTGIVQLDVNYGDQGEIRLRNATDSVTWSNWRTFLTSYNYNNYSPTLTGGGASGTWGINITGNAATAATATTADQIDSWAFRNTGSNSAVNADTIESNGITYYTSGVTNFSGNASDGALYSQFYSSSWQHQIAGDYRSGQIALRGKNNGTWQAWRTVLDSGNYNSYSPTLTGGNASGTWGINITGSASLNVLKTGDTLSGDITFSNGRKGLVGVYNASQTQAVFAMGPSYRLTDGGASNVYGDFYGIAWSYDPDYGGAGNNPQSKAGLAHQLLVMNAGVTKTAIGNGIWTSGAISQNGNQVLHAGNYTSYSPSLTGSGASGTWSINVTGNAGTAYGLNVHTGRNNEANKVVRTDGNGYIQAGYINSSSGNEGNNSSPARVWGTNGTDDYLRTYLTSALSVNYAASAGSVAWTNVSGRPTAVSSFTNDSGYITSAGRAYPRRSDGGDLNFYWSGQSGQPTWLWGGTDGTNMYVYNPSNFSVNYAATAGSAPANGGTSSAVTINYNNNSNSTYQMLWGSGNSVYGTAEIYCNPSTDYLYSGAFVASNWFRSTGNTGWYSESHGGGIYMEDTTWVRVYNSKAFYVANQIAATGNVTAYYSDQRLKTNLGNITGALNKITKLNGFRYQNNDVAKSYGYTSDKVQLGISAQEVEELFPEVVSLAPFDMETDKETGEVFSKSGQNYKTVAYDKLVPVLIEALKECATYLENQEARISSLEALVKSLITKE